MSDLNEVVLIKNACKIIQSSSNEEVPDGAIEVDAAIIFAKNKCIDIKLDMSVDNSNPIKYLIQLSEINNQTYNLHKVNNDIKLTIYNSNGDIIDVLSYYTVVKDLSKLPIQLSFFDPIPEILHYDKGNSEIYISIKDQKAIVVVTGIWSTVPEHLKHIFEKLQYTSHQCGTDEMHVYQYADFAPIFYERYYK